MSLVRWFVCDVRWILSGCLRSHPLPLATYSHTPGGALLALPHAIDRFQCYLRAIHHTSDKYDQRLSCTKRPSGLGAERSRGIDFSRRVAQGSFQAWRGLSRDDFFAFFAGSLLARMAVKRDASQHPADVRACIQHLGVSSVAGSRFFREWWRFFLR